MVRYLPSPERQGEIRNIDNLGAKRKRIRDEKDRICVKEEQAKQLTFGEKGHFGNGSSLDSC
ncbi:MAG: hypothetical protein LE168_05870 [Endomicrobium sp.]|nr:hypothetical protein [Endomicrobium sp.]